MDNGKYSKDDAYHILELINNWINNVDAKISFALAYATVFVGIVFVNASPTVFQEIVKMENITGYMVIKAIIVMLLYSTSFLSIVFMFSALKAQIEKLVGWKKSKFRKSVNVSNNKSVMFFGIIALNSFDDFKTKSMNINDKELIEEILEQIHINSKICTRKMRLYNRGLFWLFISTALCFVSALLNII